MIGGPWYLLARAPARTMVDVGTRGDAFDYTPIGAGPTTAGGHPAVRYWRRAGAAPPSPGVHRRPGRPVSGRPEPRAPPPARPPRGWDRGRARRDAVARRDVALSHLADHRH